LLLFHPTETWGKIRKQPDLQPHGQSAQPLVLCRWQRRTPQDHRADGGLGTLQQGLIPPPVPRQPQAVSKEKPEAGSQEEPLHKHNVLEKRERNHRLTPCNVCRMRCSNTGKLNGLATWSQAPNSRASNTHSG